MSKSYFERRIFGQNDQTDELQDQTPNLGSLKSGTVGAPSQPYRFGASRKASRPPIAASDSARAAARNAERGEGPIPASVEAAATPDQHHGWQASHELRSRLGMHNHAPAQAPFEQDPYTPAPHVPHAFGPSWEQQEEPAIDYERRAVEQERLMDDITGYPAEQGDAVPYPLSAPQPSIQASEPSFGFHSAEDLNPQAAVRPTEPTYQAAPVATTATHAVSPAAAPESAVTEPRMAHAAAVGVGERVNLSDQRAGTSVNPEHYVATAENANSAGPRGPSFAPSPQAAKPGRNPLGGAAHHRANQRGQQAGGRKPAPHKNVSRGTSALPPRPPRRDRGKGGLFGVVRNGLLFLATLTGLGLLMSVSYAAFQGLRTTPDEDVAILLAPEGPFKLRPDEAGVDPDVAAGRTFEADLTVLSDPRGVLEPSDERYASDVDEGPTMTMNFGGQALIVPQIDSAQPAVVLEPVTEIPAAQPIAAVPGTSAATPGIPAATEMSVTPDAVAPSELTEEPLANASPLANGLNDLIIPQARGSVPADYQGLITRIQASAGANASAGLGAAAAQSQTAPALVPETQVSGSGAVSLVAGQRGSTAVAIDPASGLPTTPQAPTLSGAAVVSPFGIQLASLRTEEQARILWKRLQDKYPSLLGGLSSRVVKFDSTSRGIFYRLQAGPMPTKTTAVDFCVKLKAQGQECIFVNG